MADSTDILKSLSSLEEDLLQRRLPMPSRVEVTSEVMEHLRRTYTAEDDERRRMMRFVGLDIVVDETLPSPGWRFVWPEGYEPDPVLVVRSRLPLDLPEGKVGYRIGHDLLIMDAEGEALPPSDATGRAFKEVAVSDPEVSERIRNILDEAIRNSPGDRYLPSDSLFSPEQWDLIMGEERTPSRDIPSPRYKEQGQ